MGESVRFGGADHQLKDGRTQLAYKAEHAMDLDTGAVVALTVQPADRGDPESLRATLGKAGRVMAEMRARRPKPRRSDR